MQSNTCIMINLSFVSVLVKYTPPQSFVFPTRAFGQGENMRLRACNISWLSGPNSFEWAHYDVARDVVLCYICTVAAKKGIAPIKGINMF